MATQICEFEEKNSQRVKNFKLGYCHDGGGMFIIMTV